MTDNRDKLIARAKMAEQTERYDDMFHNMKTVAEMGGLLQQEERELLSVAFKVGLSK